MESSNLPVRTVTSLPLWRLLPGKRNLTKLKNKRTFFYFFFFAQHLPVAETRSEFWECCRAAPCTFCWSSVQKNRLAREEGQRQTQVLLLACIHKTPANICLLIWERVLIFSAERGFLSHDKPAKSISFQEKSCWMRCVTVKTLSEHELGTAVSFCTLLLSYSTAAPRLWFQLRKPLCQAERKPSWCAQIMLDLCAVKCMTKR